MAFAVKKSIPELPFVYSINGVGLTIFTLGKKKATSNGPTEKQLSPHQK